MRCSYDSLLKSRASFDGRNAILRMSYGFLAICKTAFELTCTTAILCLLWCLRFHQQNLAARSYIYSTKTNHTFLNNAIQIEKSTFLCSYMYFVLITILVLISLAWFIRSTCAYFWLRSAGMHLLSILFNKVALSDTCR